MKITMVDGTVYAGANSVGSVTYLAFLQADGSLKEVPANNVRLVEYETGEMPGTVLGLITIPRELARAFVH